MAKLFDRFFRENVSQAVIGSYLGVDIGTTSIKAVEVTVNQGRATLVNYGAIESQDYLERANSVIQTSLFNISNGNAVEMLKILVAQMKTKTKRVVAVIPSFSVFTSTIDLPIMSSAETAQAIPHQARALVPLPMSDVTIDWAPVCQFEGSDGVKKQRIFLISVPNEQINAHKEVFKKAGLSLKLLEVDGISIARALTTEREEDVLILDMGALTSTIVIAGRGSLKYLNQTDFAGNSLTQSLTKGLGVSAKRAEALKRQKGLSGIIGEHGLSTMMIPFIDVILHEMIKAREIFEQNGGKISKVILSGGGGGMNGLASYIEKRIQIVTEVANPWSAVSYPLMFSPLLQPIAPRFTVAVGVGLKPFIE